MSIKPDEVITIKTGLMAMSFLYGLQTDVMSQGFRHICDSALEYISQCEAQIKGGESC